MLSNHHTLWTRVYEDLKIALQSHVTTDWISQVVAPGYGALIRASYPITISYYKMESSETFTPDQDTLLGEVKMWSTAYYPNPYATAAF